MYSPNTMDRPRGSVARFGFGNIPARWASLASSTGTHQHDPHPKDLKLAYHYNGEAVNGAHDCTTSERRTRRVWRL